MKTFWNQYKRQIILSSVITLLPIFIGLLLWNQLPDSLNIHWGADGAPDSTAAKATAVFLPSVILLAVNWLCLFLSYLDKKSWNQNQKAMGVVFWIIPCLSFLCNAMILGSAMGFTWNVMRLLPLLLGAMFAIIGNLMPKVRQNSSLGIKLYWTLGNEENWNKTHRLAGKLWFVGGMLLIVSALLPTNALIVAMITIFLLMILIPTAYSYWIYRQHKAAGIVYNLNVNTKAQKVSAKVMAVFLPILVVVLCVVMFTGDIETVCTDGILEIQADFWEDLSLPISDIDSISYHETAPSGYRLSGFGSARFSLGTFQNKDLGTYTSYVYTGCDAHIVITVGQKKLVLNAKTPEETRQIYEAILLAIEE